MESNELENREDWKNFLRPLPSKRKTKNGCRKKICDKKTGNECLSQEFAIKLMRGKPYCIKTEPSISEKDTSIQQNKPSSQIKEQAGIRVCDVSTTYDIDKHIVHAPKEDENSRECPIIISDEGPSTSQLGFVTESLKNSPNTFVSSGMSRKPKLKRISKKPYTAIKTKRKGETPKLSVVARDAESYTIERQRKRARRTKSNIIANQKDDFDLPCSQWNIDLISRYFNFKNCVEKLDLRENIDNHEFFLHKIFEEFKHRMIIASSAVKHNIGNNDGTLNFTSLCNNETGTRLVLNEIMFPLCAYMGLSIEIEKNVDCNFLPFSRFDYRVVNSDGDVVGAVEAKSAGSLCQTSVAQALVQLCVLQTEHLDKKDISQVVNMPLFNIVTDGIRYIFIVLRGKKLQFEQVDGMVSVREVTSWTDVRGLYRSLLNFMRIHTEPPEIIDLSNENDIELIEMNLI